MCTSTMACILYACLHTHSCTHIYIISGAVLRTSSRTLPFSTVVRAVAVHRIRSIYLCLHRLGLAVPFVCRTLDRLRLGRVRVALRVCVVLRVRVVVLVRGRRVSRHVGLFREQLHLELVLRDRVAPRPVSHLVSDTDAHRHTNILGPRERDADGTAARSRCSAPGALSCVRPHFVVCECVCVWRAHACASVLTLSIISIIDTGWHFGDHGSAEQSTASSVGPPLKNTFGSVRG